MGLCRLLEPFFLGDGCSCSLCSLLGFAFVEDEDGAAAAVKASKFHHRVLPTTLSRSPNFAIRSHDVGGAAAMRACVGDETAQKEKNDRSKIRHFSKKKLNLTIIKIGLLFL